MRPRGNVLPIILGSVVFLGIYLIWNQQAWTSQVEDLKLENQRLIEEIEILKEKEFGLGEDNEKLKIETRRLSEETSLKDKQLNDLRNEGDAYRRKEEELKFELSSKDFEVEAKEKEATGKTNELQYRLDDIILENKEQVDVLNAQIDALKEQNQLLHEEIDSLIETAEMKDEPQDPEVGREADLKDADTPNSENLDEDRNEDENEGAAQGENGDDATFEERPDDEDYDADKLIDSETGEVIEPDSPYDQEDVQESISEDLPEDLSEDYNHGEGDNQDDHDLEDIVSEDIEPETPLDDQSNYENYESNDESNHELNHESKDYQLAGYESESKYQSDEQLENENDAFLPSNEQEV